jgi:hypothetical protein
MQTRETTEVTASESPRACPTFAVTENGIVEVHVSEVGMVRQLYGLRTGGAASGILKSAIDALGHAGAEYRPFIVAIAAELEPQNAVEAMLVTQMAATHAAMAKLSRLTADANNWHVRESCERSMTRLSRTYLAQMDALKRYRAKAQHIVRVERVVVEEGGQAIVGTVAHGGRAENENCR